MCALGKDVDEVFVPIPQYAIWVFGLILKDWICFDLRDVICRVNDPRMLLGLE